MIGHTFLPTSNHKKLAVVVFDKPKALNAQDMTMVQTLNGLLQAWQDDPSVVAIVLRGAGDKAFCAGGDIKGLYHHIVAQEQMAVRAFFEAEYRLIHRIHTYPKPMIAWGDGIVMGGGLGVFAGCSHKVVTDNTTMAMPEVSIGLFADAGGSYFLRRMMNKVGLFLGLTGARFDGVDAYHLGLGDFVMCQGDYEAMLKALEQTQWTDNAMENKALASQALQTLHSDEMGVSVVLEHLPQINALMNAGTLDDIDRALRAYDGDSAWLKASIEVYEAGSPTTKALTYLLYHTVSGLSLGQVLALELNVAQACCAVGDFCEGVRALLIDKDKNPNWQTVGDVSVYLDSPYGDAHPFACLA